MLFLIPKHPNFISFVNIKADVKEVSDEELHQAAIFCAKYSQAWKKAKVKRDVLVSVFIGKNIFKTKEMKLGCFGIKKSKEIKVKKEDVESFGVN